MKENLYKVYEHIRDDENVTSSLSNTKKIMLELLENNSETLEYCIKKSQEEFREVEEAKFGKHFHEGMTKREILVNEISQYMYWLIIMDVSKKVSYENTKVFEKIEQIIYTIDVSKIEENENITLEEVISHDLESMSNKEYLKHVV